MSETVHYKGKLKLVIKTEDKEFLEDVCKQILIKHGIEELDFYESWREQLENEMHNDYTIVKNKGIYSVYKILSRSDVDVYEMFNITKTSDDEYEYEVMYCNRYMGLSEAIEESFKRLGE